MKYFSVFNYYYVLMHNKHEFGQIFWKINKRAACLFGNAAYSNKGTYLISRWKVQQFTERSDFWSVEP